MSDILDEPINGYEENKYTEAAYEKCKTATIYFVLAILIGILTFMINIPSNIAGMITGILFILSSIYGGLGFVKSLKSIHYKEEDTVKKWLSSILNLIFVAIIFSMILTNLMDVFNALGF